MKQILVISGKGGTGKTVITAAFAGLAQNNIMADCDVDAADLHLLMHPEIKEQGVFKSGFLPVIDQKKCNRCGRCREICRFGAIDERVTIDPVSCEGCAFCSHICPEEAISLVERECGRWYVSDSRFGALVHARLGPGEENSGKLVAFIKEKAVKLSEESGKDLILIDGSPGIGCPVIASLSGVNLAVVVTEPTLSGLHDAQRVIEVARHFGVSSRLVINKYDLNEKTSEQIEDHFNGREVATIGKIPYDPLVIKSVVRGRTILETGENRISDGIREIWKRVCECVS